MPATSRNGECLQHERISRLLPELALEVDDHEIIARYQHLT